jgi:carbonic anhydrase
MSLKHDILTAEAIQRLKDDDQRLLRGASPFPRIQPEVRAELAKGQEPYAAILGCSDWRFHPNTSLFVRFLP